MRRPFQSIYFGSFCVFLPITECKRYFLHYNIPNAFSVSILREYNFLDDLQKSSNHVDWKSFPPTNMQEFLYSLYLGW